MNRRLAGAGDRARFLREGQLAAALNHPNAVYVFGSEEVDGTPVIAMELVAGGTLKDVVDRDGPMAPGAAVDAILQVVAGLDAALSCGILHRDVKPSNCFVDPGGAVKVGDFGLSIPVAAPEITQHGEMATIQGTPQFAAPEQLRGDPLDLRADIYAVGATLYYLLTGQPPFEDRELMALLTRVATEAPASPRQRGTDIPAGLSAVVLRCLAKEPSGRPATYAELEASLRPFDSSVPAPASLGLRAAAGAIDWVLLAAATAPLAVTLVLELAANDSINASITYSGPRDLKSSMWVTLTAGALAVLYYGVLEGRWGRSLGKQVCGLEVAARSGAPAGTRRAVLRVLVFVLPIWFAVLAKLIAAAAGVGVAAAGWAASVADWGSDAISLLIFTSMRRRNGLAAWHDLASGTRVVTARRRKVRDALDAPDAASPQDPGSARTARVGPYEVVGHVGHTDTGTMLAGFDPALKRNVWIHVLPPGAPPVGAARADLGRAGRLRWMSGRRAPDEAWDVYEAPGGAPFLDVCATPRPWRAVQHWIADLARELADAADDGSTPALALDRVWITGGSQARLLDFQAPGLAAASQASRGDSVADPQRFLARVMAHALGASDGRASGAALPHGPLPRLAQATLDTLDRGGFHSLTAAAERASALTESPDHVTRARRAASILLANVPLFAAMIALAIGLPAAVRLLQPGLLTMTQSLVAIRGFEGKSDAKSSATRHALELYVADRFHAELADERTWRDPRTARLLAPLRPVASRILDARRAPSDEERRAARAAAEAYLGNPASIRTQALGIAAILPAVVLLISAIAALMSALLFRGGLLLRLLGLAVVSARGSDVTRIRALCRAVVAWLPVLLFWVYVWASSAAGREVWDVFSNWWVPAAAAAAGFAGCVWAVLHPGRGLPDRLTGTNLVPR